MKKRISILLLSILLLVGCAETKKQPAQEKESSNQMVKIESNIPKIKETKNIDVVKLYKQTDNTYEEKEKELIDSTFSLFNNTEQVVYRDSLTFIPANTFYEEDGVVYFYGILYNNTGNSIKSIKFGCDVNIVTNETIIQLEGAFELKSTYYPFMNSDEGLNVVLGFERSEENNLDALNSNTVIDDIEVKLKNIEFFQINN
ncbi:hypothetical protein [Isobaculum melis]|uniref:Lipoprotein n=1 Tax=Isobaculum melis TaxID=142588 RepID=A0A1H9S083_9LACT|nr:hypothetical protein [Isobaculum melis]SER78338.1 hypothetical protein SAMN04488559_1064 [Isobaculum melis]